MLTGFTPASGPVKERCWCHLVSLSLNNNEPLPPGSNQRAYAAYRVGLAVLMVAGIVAHIIEFTEENPGWKWLIYMTNQVRELLLRLICSITKTLIII